MGESKAMKDFNGRYILRGKDAVPEPDLLKWAKWFQTADRKVAVDLIGPYRISTVFLGLDHRFGNGPPLLFETMVFGEFSPFDDLDQERCSTWDEATAQHASIAAKYRAMVAGSAQ